MDRSDSEIEIPTAMGTGEPTGIDLRAARVQDYARRPALVVSPELAVRDVAALFQREGVSGAPVADGDGRALGVISVTDLIALALFGHSSSQRTSPPDEDAGPIPDLGRLGSLRVRDVMTPAVWSARPAEPLGVATQRLLDVRIHRLVVIDRRERVEGLLSTVDLVRAVRDARLPDPIARYATRAAESVEVGTPVSAVMKRLLEAGFTGMPVTDGGWPIGFVSQAELLRARNRSASTAVEEIASPAMLCLPGRWPLWAAAEEAIRQTIRRILVVHARQVRGILTSVDFARAVADAVS